MSERTFKPSPAEQAASWLISMEDVVERGRLYNRHRMLRKPVYRDGFMGADHSEADAWLIDEWERATGGDK